MAQSCAGDLLTALSLWDRGLGPSDTSLNANTGIIRPIPTVQGHNMRP